MRIKLLVFFLSLLSTNSKVAGSRATVTELQTSAASDVLTTKRTTRPTAWESSASSPSVTDTVRFYHFHKRWLNYFTLFRNNSNGYENKTSIRIFLFRSTQFCADLKTFFQILYMLLKYLNIGTYATWIEVFLFNSDMILIKKVVRIF